MGATSAGKARSDGGRAIGAAARVGSGFSAACRSAIGACTANDERHKRTLAQVTEKEAARIKAAARPAMIMRRRDRLAMKELIAGCTGRSPDWASASTSAGSA